MQLLLELAQPAAPSLGNFVAGQNQEIVGTLRVWLEGRCAEPCVYLWGPQGCGKTHLLRAVSGDAAERGRGTCYVAAGERFAESAMTAHWLAVDDVHRLDTEGESVLFTVLNRAAAGEARLLLAGDNAPNGLGLRPDVRTRIAAGLVLQLKPLSDEDKAQALRGHARTRGFALTPEAADYLLRHGQRDLPSLLSVLDAADRYSLQEKRAITVPLLREVLQIADAAAAGGSHMPAR